MQKLLISISSQVLADALVQALSSRFKVHCCGTGADACRLAEQLRPDALIIDLRLSDGDGFSVLERCRYKPPAVLMFTDLRTSEIVQRAASAGVGALVMIPCSVWHVAEVLDQIVTKTPSPEG